MGLEAQGPHVRIGDLLPRLVARGIQERLDFESAPRGGAANEVHHRFETDQRPPLPVQADEREEAMLNLVPLTRARWVMADDDRAYGPKTQSKNSDLGPGMPCARRRSPLGFWGFVVVCDAASTPR